MPSLPPRELALSRVPSTEHKRTVYVTTSPHNEDILEPSPHWLTNTNWFLSRPLATLLAGNCFLSLQLKGRLALKLQTVPVAKCGSFSPAVGWDPRITAAPLVNLWKKRKQKLHGRKALTPSWHSACRTSALRAACQRSSKDIASPRERRSPPHHLTQEGDQQWCRTQPRSVFNTWILPLSRKGPPNNLS